MFTSQKELPFKLDVQRLTALWGFSEATLGAILHLLKIPLTGLFIGGAAVFFIALIYRNSESPSQILKSTLIVVLIKAVITPFIPLNSYFAVTLQGSLGYLFFRFIPSFKFASVLLGMITLTLSALQKLIIITIVFGNSFWDAIDSFATFIITQHSFLADLESLKLSLIIISIYTSIHFLAGMYIGFKVSRVDSWLERKRKSFNFDDLKNISGNSIFHNTKPPKRRSWWRKKSGIFLLVFSVGLLALSYWMPHFGKSTSLNILIMIIRSILISIIWFNIISPILLKQFRIFIDKKKFDHASEINKLTSLFPHFKSVISYSWNETSELIGMRRVYVFLSNSLALLLILDIKNEQD